MTRLLGIPPQKIRPVLARDQLQKSYPASPLEPLPQPYAAAAVTPEKLGIVDGPSVEFVMFGDCGGVADPNPQKLVAQAIQDLRESKAISPAFALIVGDLVYYNGDPLQWSPQFYEPYSVALGGVPIIGFPGNHDGDSSDGVAGSGISTFIANMCTASPQVPPGDPQLEFGRHTMTLPYCDWCLELEALTIIAVWSNVPSGGDLDPDQVEFITAQLKAARPGIPVMLGLHHPPYSVDAHHGGSAKMGQLVDQCATAAGRWPDIVVSGHVHDYQHFVRSVNDAHVAGGDLYIAEIPYLVVGAGGYHNRHQLASDAVPGLQVAADVVFEKGDDKEWGFAIVTAGSGKVSSEYVGVAADGTVTRNVDTFATA